MADQTATPPRDQRPRRWWEGRATVAEILAAGDEAARPTWPRPPLVRGVLGGQQQRRRQELPSPPRRERPPDLETTAIGVDLYGARRAVPWPFAEVGPASTVPADATGTALSYKPLEGRSARVRGIRVNRSAASAALVYQVQLLRAGATHVLYAVTDADLTVEAPITLQPGDELRVAIVTAGAAGTTITSHLSIEERT